MYFRRLANDAFQKVVPLRVYPWPRTATKPVSSKMTPNEAANKKQPNVPPLMDYDKRNRDR